MTARGAVIAAAAVLLSAFGTAGEAMAARVDICYSDVAAPNAAPPTSATPFTCPQAGRKTLPELAAAGWRVLKMTPVTVADGGFGVRQQLLIRDDGLFASGFDPP